MLSHIKPLHVICYDQYDWPINRLRFLFISYLQKKEVKVAPYGFVQVQPDL